MFTSPFIRTKGGKLWFKLTLRKYFFKTWNHFLKMREIWWFKYYICPFYMQIGKSETNLNWSVLIPTDGHPGAHTYIRQILRLRNLIENLWNLVAQLRESNYVQLWFYLLKSWYLLLLPVKKTYFSLSVYSKERFPRKYLLNLLKIENESLRLSVESTCTTLLCPIWVSVLNSNDVS